MWPRLRDLRVVALFFFLLVLDLLEESLFVRVFPAAGMGGKPETMRLGVIGVGLLFSFCCLRSHLVKEDDAELRVCSGKISW